MPIRRRPWPKRAKDTRRTDKRQTTRAPAVLPIPYQRYVQITASSSGTEANKSPVAQGGLAWQAAVKLESD